MSLDHILLGILNDKPLSGYEVNKWYQHVLKYFWPADQRTIYRALNRMYDNGWLLADLVVQDDSPNKKVYQLTPNGKVELKKWLSTPLPITIHPSPWLAQLFFGNQISYDALVVNLRARQNQLKAELEELERRTGRHDPTIQPPVVELPPHWIRGLTLSYGLESIRFQIDWLDRAIRYVSKGEALTRDDLARFIYEGTVED